METTMHPVLRTATAGGTYTRHLTENLYRPTPTCGTRTKRAPMLDAEPGRITCKRCAAILLEWMTTPGRLTADELHHAADSLLCWTLELGSSVRYLTRDGIGYTITSTPGGQRYAVETSRPLPLEAAR
jgi:hypothetical protein